MKTLLTIYVIGIIVEALYSLVFGIIGVIGLTYKGITIPEFIDDMGLGTTCLILAIIIILGSAIQAAIWPLTIIVDAVIGKINAMNNFGFFDD